MYRCHFCGECSAPKAPMLRHSRTKVVPLLPKTEIIAYKGEDGRIRRRDVVVESNRSSTQSIEELPVCKECYSALKEGVSESRLQAFLKAQGKAPVNRRALTYDGLSMRFGGAATGEGGEAHAPTVFISKPLKRVVRFGSNE